MSNEARIDLIQAIATYIYERENEYGKDTFKRVEKDQRNPQDSNKEETRQFD